jgi:hypothetical protein
MRDFFLMMCGLLALGCLVTSAHMTLHGLNKDEPCRGDRAAWQIWHAEKTVCFLAIHIGNLLYVTSLF